MPDEKNARGLSPKEMVEADQNVVRVLELMAREMGENPDSPEWMEFEEALDRFRKGEDAGGAGLGQFLLQNLRDFSSGRKNFIRSAKGQEVAQRAVQTLVQNPEALRHPVFAPLLQHIRTVAPHHRDAERVARLKVNEKDLEGWVVVSDGDGIDRGAPDQKKKQEKKEEQEQKAGKLKEEALERLEEQAEREEAQERLEEQAENAESQEPGQPGPGLPM